MLNLSSVSLLCWCTENHAAASKAFDFSRRDISYRNHLLFTDKPEAFSVDAKTVVTVVEPLACKQDGCVIQCTRSFDMLLPIMGEFTLGIQHDGFPINPQVWTDDFLAWDFTGSLMWNAVNGNNGFCLSSRKYYECIRGLVLQPTHESCFPSDQVLNAKHRAEMEMQGCRYAPDDLCRRFARENMPPYGDDVFGGHAPLFLADVVAQGRY